MKKYQVKHHKNRRIKKGKNETLRECPRRIVETLDTHWQLFHHQICAGPFRKKTLNWQTNNSKSSIPNHHFHCNF